MSLFPAADKNLKIKDEDGSNLSKSGWLQNVSYDKPIPAIPHQIKPQIFVKESKELPLHASEYKIKKKSKKKKSKKSNYDEDIDVEKQTRKDNIKRNTEGTKKTSMVVDNIQNQSALYIADKVMDKDNCYFQRPYNVDIPKFYRQLIECVGVPWYRSMIVGETKKFKEEKTSKKNRFSDRYFHKNNRKLLLTRPSCEFTCKSKSINIHDDYIKLSSSDATNEKLINEEETTVAEIDPLKLKVENFNKTLRNNPTDTETWFGLLNLQEDIIGKNSHNRERLIFEKKIAILERAISENNLFIPFRIMHLELKAKVSSDYQAIEKEWSSLCFKFPDNLDLWEGFIKYLTTSNTIKFTIQKAEKSFGHCLSVLRAMQAGSFRTTSSILIVEKNLIRIFKQYVDFLWCSGYIEKSILCVVYLLEFNFRKPESKDSLNDLLESLEKFYISSQPKLGQEQSTGWRLWHTQFTKGGWSKSDEEEESSDEEDDMEFEETLMDSKASVMENWLKIETYRSSPKTQSIHKCSSQKSDSFIPFSEIKPAMFLVSDSALKLEMCKTLLHILGTPINYATTEDVVFKKQGLYRWTNAKQLLTKSLSSVCICKPFLFSRTESEPNSKKIDAHELILNIFEQLIMSVDGNDALKKSLQIELVEYLENRILALSSHAKSIKKTAGKEARKTAKYILKKNQDLFEVWTRLCRIEWLLGNHEESIRILQHMILLVSHDFKGRNIGKIIKTDEFKKLMLMFCSLVQLFWQTINNNILISAEIKNKLLSTFAGFGDDLKFSDYFKRYSASEDLPFSPGEVLKISNGWKRIYTETKSSYKPNTTSHVDMSVFASSAICYVIFNILFNRLNDVPSLFEDVIQVLTSQQISEQVNHDLEHVLMMQMYYLKYHEICRKLTRQHAYNASARFPNNPIFANVLTEIDMPSYLSANAHRHFNKICKTDLIVPWLMYVNFELQRNERLINETDVVPQDVAGYKLYNVLKRATSTQSPAIWRLFLSTEAKKSMEDANALYFKAIDSCPWTKQIYLDFIEINPDMLTNVIDTMTDKGLMVRTQIEEVELMIS